MEKVKSKEALQLWQITKINVRHNFLPYFLLSILLLMLTPILFGVSNLDTQASAVPLEIFVSLLGIILLTPIFHPEEDDQIEQVVASKYVGLVYVYIIRIVYSLIILILLIGLFILYMGLQNCNITPQLFGGTIVTAMLLGSLGMLAASVSKNIAVSYMVPVVYYLLNLTGGRNLGSFYLFSMMTQEYRAKLFLFIWSTVIMAMSLLVIWLKGKLR
ncbi:hypothetical protein [Alkaliphilus crotonatoxidans]